MHSRKNKKGMINMWNIEGLSKIRFSKLRESARLPEKREEDAGYDLYASLEEGQESIVILPHTSVLIPTGLKSVMPDSYCALILERGSTGVKNLKINAGLIDSGFRGEWKVVLYNGNTKPVLLTNSIQNREDVLEYDLSKAIAQFIVLMVPKVEIVEVTEQEIQEEKSLRMEGMIGSSGK